MTNKDAQQISLLLPFYVNGSLDTKETQLVEKALSENNALQQELNLLRNIQTEMKAMPASEHSLGQAGLIRLKNSLPTKSTVNNAKKWRLSTIIAAIILAVQTSFMVLAPTVYMQSGEQQSQALIVVSFSPSASEQEIRTILLRYNLTIVEGPSALGLYKLASSNSLDDVVKQLQTIGIIESADVEQ